MNIKQIRLLAYVALIGWVGFKYGYPFYKTFNAPSETKELYNTLLSDGLPWQTYAHSTLGNNIYLMELGEGESTTLIFGGFHGDEPGGFHLVVELARYLYANPGLIKSRVVFVPVLNPDGLLENKRLNSNKTDINRNFPTMNWTPVYSDYSYYPGREAGSEVETQVALRLLAEYKPAKIISIHSSLHLINFDGHALSLASEMARSNGYEIASHIGYATPGSFGTYAGKELDIPTITLELPLYDPEQAWKDNKEALIKAINF
jgi:murein peptide amidase A